MENTNLKTNQDNTNLDLKETKKNSIYKRIILQILLYIAGIIIGLAGVKILGPKAAIRYFSGGITGLLLGLVPLLLAKKRNLKKLGRIFFTTCIICGAIGGIILTLPLAVIFSIIIYKKAQNTAI